MIHALRLTNYRGIRALELHELGRINVVCGKNNSGKSSILQAVVANGTAEAGRRVDEQLLSELPIRLANGIPNASAGVGAGVLERVVREAFKVDEIWFSTGADHRKDRLIAQLVSTPLGRGRPNEDYLHNVLTSVCAVPLNATIIPAQRRLDASVAHSSPQNVGADGTGVLSRLFHMSTKPPGHQLHQEFRQISDAFNEISGGFGLGAFSADDGVTVHFEVPGRSWVPSSECGLGLQDLVVVLFFAVTAKEPFICIEEPETHLHPAMQKRLLSFLRNATDKQYLLATHSNVFLSPTLVDRVYLAKADGETVSASDQTSRSDMLGELGYDVADNLVSDVVILTEGPTDIPILEEFLSRMGTLSKYAVKFWPLGGDIMQYVDLSVLVERGKVLALVDGDPGSNIVRERFVRTCKELRIPVTRLKRRSVENYFTVSALRQVFKAQIPDGFATLSDGATVEKQLGFAIKKRNRHIARAMSLDDLSGTDLLEFLHGVETVCKA